MDSTQPNQGQSESPHDRPFTITRFPDQFARTKKERTETPRQWAARIARIEANSKTELPFFKAGLFGDVATEKGCLRHDANVLAVTGVEGDHDAGNMQPEEAKALLEAARVAAVVYSTPSNRPDRPRWRVLCPLSAPLPPARRAALVARLNGVLKGVLAGESFTLSQAFYAGAVRGGPPVQTFLVDGRYLDLCEELDAAATGKPGRVATGDGSGGRLDEEAAREAIRSGSVIYPNLVALVGKWAGAGVGYVEADRRLKALLHEIPEADRDERWRDRMSKVPSILVGIYTKEVVARAEAPARIASAFDSVMDGEVILTDDDDPAGTGIPPDELAEIHELIGWPTARRKVQEAEGPRRSVAREVADRLTEGGDTANAAAFAARYRGQRLYVSATGQWLRWTGQRWAAQTAEDVTADCTAVSAEMVARAADRLRHDPSEENRASLRHATRLHGNAPALARMESLSRAEAGMSVASPADFDRNPFALAVENGVLDLREGSLRPASPDDRLSRIAGCAFDPKARAPRFLDFLTTILPDDAVRDFVRRAVGYSLTGSVDEEVFFLAHGRGANGKSVFANVLSAMMGEYAGSFGAALVTRGKHENEAQRMVARLPGLRLALVNETATGDLWDSARLKELASRERIAARKLYTESFDFWPTHKLWIRTNHLPGSLDAGDGFWRRCIPVGFAVQIPEADRMPDLDRRIIATELPGVLNWALEGARQWAEGGLRVPAVIRREAESYRQDTDLLGQWVAECTVPDPAGKSRPSKVAVAEAFADFADFCRTLGAHSGTAMTFSRSMTDRGIRRDPHKGSGGRRFLGFTLKPDRHPARNFGDDDGVDLI